MSSSSIFSDIANEFYLFYRYLRRRFFSTHGAVVPPQGSETPKANSTEQVSTPQEKALAPAEIPVGPEAPVTASASTPQPLTQEEISARLMNTFAAKLNAREARKRQAIAESNRKNPHVSNRQLTIDFDPAPVQEPTPVPSHFPENNDAYQLPETTLFSVSAPGQEIDLEEINQVSRKIQDCIDNFNIDAEVSGAIRGPRITLHKVHVAHGVRVAALGSYEKDLAMALSAPSLRLLLPVPGYDYAGIEVPNTTSDSVLIGDIINSRAWSGSRAKLPLILGKNIEGENVILDLTKAPHLIVAGATGSGKSVCLNTFIVSLTTRFSPKNLRMLLVDPKQVEMNMYNPLPHLLTPVIIDATNVVLALKWLVWEMGNRYTLLSLAKVRNLEDYNARKRPDTPVLDESGNPIPDFLPYIVLIIDELADLMLTNRQDIENSLARLAQMSRAVGIHTIVATQRPSVDVLTGVIKANFPTRIAFKTSSQVDSRTILDSKGAESLLGKGDMLFKPPTADGMVRIQAAMVTDEEINTLVQFCALQQQAPDSFDIIKTAATEENASKGNEGDIDTDDGSDEALIKAAATLVVRDQKPSISYIQRRLKVGYNKAASLMEILEQRGIVGPQQGTMKREILVTEEEL